MAQANPGAGRPKGSFKTSQGVLKKELEEAVLLNRKYRELANRIIRNLSKVVEDSPNNVEVQLKVLDSITSAIGGQGRSLDSVAKHIPAITKQQQTEPSDTTKNVEELLKDMKG